MNPSANITPLFTPPAPTKQMAGSNFGYSGKKFKPTKKRSFESIHCPQRELLPITFNKVNGVEMY